MDWENFRPLYYSWYESMVAGNWVALPIVFFAVAGALAAFASFFSSDGMRTIAKAMSVGVVIISILGGVAWLATGVSPFTGKVAAWGVILLGLLMLAVSACAILVVVAMSTRQKSRFRMLLIPLVKLYARTVQWQMDNRHELMRRRRSQPQERPQPVFPVRRAIVHTLKNRFSIPKAVERIGVSLLLFWFGANLLASVFTGALDQDKIAREAQAGTQSFFTSVSYILPPVDVDSSIVELRHWAACRYSVEITSTEARGLLEGLLPAGLQIGPLYKDQGGGVFVPSEVESNGKSIVKVRELRLVHSGAQSYVLLADGKPLSPATSGKAGCGAWMERRR